MGLSFERGVIVLGLVLAERELRLLI